MITDTAEVSAKTRTQILREQRRAARHKNHVSEVRRQANELALQSRHQKADLCKIVRIDFLFPQIKTPVLAVPLLCRVTPDEYLNDEQIAEWNRIWEQLLPEG